MKNKIIFIGIALLNIMVFFACTKKGTGSSGGDFSINNISYKVTSSVEVKAGNTIYYTFTNFDQSTLNSQSVNFYFSGNSKPSSGTYNLVSGTPNMGANDVFVMAVQTNASTSTTKEYNSEGVSGTVKVTTKGNEVEIEMNTYNLKEQGAQTNIPVEADVNINVP